MLTPDSAVTTPNQNGEHTVIPSLVPVVQQLPNASLFLQVKNNAKQHTKGKRPSLLLLYRK